MTTFKDCLGSLGGKTLKIVFDIAPTLYVGAKDSFRINPKKKLMDLMNNLH